MKEPVIDQRIVSRMRQMLRKVITEGTGKKALALDREVFGKTGTTNDYADAWFVGFDDKYAVGVWVGRDNHAAIGEGETGSQAALPIWIEFMANI
jgi:penicillin-binding protein 1A